MADTTLHLYLVDTTLQVLLAQRDVPIPADFMAILNKHVAAQKAAPLDEQAYRLAVQAIWAQKSPAQMREAANAVIEVPLDIPLPPSKKAMH